MAHSTDAPARAAHVNLSTDTVIKNLPVEGLRSVMRSILVSDPAFTEAFVQQAHKYLDKVKAVAAPQLFDISAHGAAQPTPGLTAYQGRLRAMLGCGLAFAALDLLRHIVDAAADFVVDDETEEGEALMDVLAVVDSDIIAAVTAAQKELMVATGVRDMTASEAASWDGLLAALLEARKKADAKDAEFMFERGANVMIHGL